MKFRITGPAATIYVILWVALMVWSIYLTYKIAGHVGAWPFAVAWGS